MFFSTIDLGALVTLEEPELGPQRIVQALSKTLRCNVFIDGFISDTPIGRPGTYRAHEVLDMAFAAWGCSWGIERSTVYFAREFSKESQFPDLAQEELVAFACAISERMTRRYPTLVHAEIPGTITSRFREIVRKMPPEKQKQAESQEGLVIGTLNPALQAELLHVLQDNAYGDAVRRWSAIDTIFQDLNHLQASVDFWYLEFAGPRTYARQRLEYKEKATEEELAGLKARLGKGCARVADFVKKTQLTAPPAIQRHFITAAALVDEPAFLAALAKLHGWDYRQESGSRATLQLKKRGPTDDVMGVVPTEYQQFIKVPQQGILYMTMSPGMQLSLQGNKLAKDASLYARLFQQLVGKRDVLDLRAATELETYTLTRALVSQAAHSFLAGIIASEKYPTRYVSDYKNTCLSVNRSVTSVLVKHPGGGLMSLSEGRVSPPG